jgi:hypothetical protein
MEACKRPANLPPFRPFTLLLIILFAFGLRVVKLNDLPLSFMPKLFLTPIRWGSAYTSLKSVSPCH